MKKKNSSFDCNHHWKLIIVEANWEVYFHFVFLSFSSLLLFVHSSSIYSNHKYVFFLSFFAIGSFYQLEVLIVSCHRETNKEMLNFYLMGNKSPARQNFMSFLIILIPKLPKHCCFSFKFNEFLQIIWCVMYR